MAFIEWLNAGKLPRECAGGKGASLSDLTAAGFDIPAGFCVSAEAYRRFVSAAGKERIGEAALPDDLSAEIARAYERLVGHGERACAVRSSAISEDGAGAASAGLYESYLNIRGVEAVLDRVRRCYASLWSERAVGYRARRSAGEADEAMAVVVMELVAAESAGVAFTAHPVSGERDIVLINASFGLGEAIVSGLVTPDSFVVRKASFEIVERDIFTKELAIDLDPAGNGTVERMLAANEAAAPSISDDQARAIARAAAAIEAHYGAPQDVEWAYAAGRLFILQSRPITTL